ncbi:DUF1176 domain-containing protein [soil metagenome]
MPAPQPGILQYDGDWAVGCDNLVRCEAIALQPDGVGGGGNNDEALLLQIMREGGPSGEVTLRASGLSQIPSEIALMIDGAESIRLTGTAGDEAVAHGPAALATLRVMASASTIELRPTGKKGRIGPVLASFSSAGLAESLRFVDARQGRVGTQSALISRGGEPDTSVPLPPPRPMVRQMPSPDADAAPGLSEPELAAARKLAVCDAMLMARDVTELFPLDGDAALLLLPCEAGVYNVSAVPLIARGTAGSRTLSIARFDFAPGFTGEPGKPPLVVNALWDSRRGVLSSLAKGRGIGDCGASEDYVWDGTMFRLIESRAMHVCRGAWEWIRLWEAQPERAPGTLPAPEQTAAAPVR